MTYYVKDTHLNNMKNSFEIILSKVLVNLATYNIINVFKYLFEFHSDFVLPNLEKIFIGIYFIKYLGKFVVKIVTFKRD